MPGFTTGLCMPKNAGLAALLKGSGTVTGMWESTLNAMSIAADPDSGASRNVDINGYIGNGALAFKTALQAWHDANSGNPSAPALQAIINSIITGWI